MYYFYKKLSCQNLLASNKHASWKIEEELTSGMKECSPHSRVASKEEQELCSHKKWQQQLLTMGFCTLGQHNTWFKPRPQHANRHPKRIWV